MFLGILGRLFYAGTKLQHESLQEKICHFICLPFGLITNICYYPLRPLARPRQLSTLQIE